MTPKEEIEQELMNARTPVSQCPNADKEDGMTEFEHVDFHVDNALNLLKNLKVSE